MVRQLALLLCESPDILVLVLRHEVAHHEAFINVQHLCQQEHDALVVDTPVVH